MAVWPVHDKDCGDIFPSTALEYQVLNTTVSPNTVDTLFPEYISWDLVWAETFLDWYHHGAKQ